MCEACSTFGLALRITSLAVWRWLLMEPLMASFLVAQCFSCATSAACWGEHSTVSKQSASAMMRAKSSSNPNPNRNPNICKIQIFVSMQNTSQITSTINYRRTHLLEPHATHGDHAIHIRPVDWVLRGELSKIDCRNVLHPGSKTRQPTPCQSMSVCRCYI